MNGDRNNDEGRGNGGGRDNGPSWWQYGAAAAAITATAGTLYYLTRQPQLETTTSTPSTTSTTTVAQSTQKRRGVLSTLAELLEPLANNSTNMEDAISSSSVPVSPNITNLNGLLADIYVRYIALKKEDFRLHYRVFTEVFSQIHNNMKEVDKYYNRYSSNIQFAGSHYDRLRIKKPDEFDVDIVIDLPVNLRRDRNLNESDIILEPNFPGFVQLRAGVQYQKLLVRDGVDCLINRTAHEWLDEKNYILRSKFTNWFKSVGNRALNRFPRRENLPACSVEGVYYTIRTSESGPAWTIIIEAPNFKLDVDLVPALRFPEDRCIEANVIRPIPPECRREYWMVVPKPNKGGNTIHDEKRSWRIALQDQEKQFLNNTYQLRQTIRFLKKFRDSQNMNGIASYYIKTLFLLEYVQLQETHQSHMWQTSDMATLFKHMLRKFYMALDKKEIPYFWNRRHNLIGNISQGLINEYKSKVQQLLSVLDDPYNYKQVAKYLLDDHEYQTYRWLL
ncbi:cyclic GMP-AMP synthase-like receptor isoform X2 [Vanessa cardui]|nr:cyclic GMP-AMP synthase-like receptor isoform X2 [Vanessa cardui]XP_046960436.1 cyclic GMP-AMP synthase-like receptor isoform X2 [Vanessa cardui]